MGGEKNLIASLGGPTAAEMERLETGTGTNSPSRDNSKVQTARNTLDSDKTSLVKLQVSARFLHSKMAQVFKSNCLMFCH